MAEDVTALGVPEMTPVVLEMLRPDGRDGETDHETTVPPVDVGLSVVMAVPLVSVMELVE